MCATVLTSGAAHCVFNNAGDLDAMSDRTNLWQTARRLLTHRGRADWCDDAC